MNYDVVVKSNTSFVDGLYTYKSDLDIRPGTRVIVPFGKGDVKTLALVIKVNRDEKIDNIKEISQVIDSSQIINQELVDLAIYMVENDISDYSSAVMTVLPPGSIDRVDEYYCAKAHTCKIDDDLFKFLSIPRTYEDIKEVFKTKYSRKYLNEQVLEGNLDAIYDTKQKSSLKYEIYYELVDYDYDQKIRKNSLKQLQILDFIKERGLSSKSEICKEIEKPSLSLKNLEEKGIIKSEKRLLYRDVLDGISSFDSPHILNEEQRRVFDTIVDSEKKAFLIHGVTGSGKTEVYLQLVAKYLSEGKQAIILVPEISLTPQTIARFQARFGNHIAVLHSKLSISQRADQWRLIRNGQVDIVVGARSAIFAPFSNLGIIIIDEEHEDSYRSDKNPKYSAIDIALIRSKFTGAKLVLGSATPAIKTMYEVYKKNFELLRMNKRVNDARLPQIHLVDMREELKSNNMTMFSNILKEKVEETLRNKKQVILFLNKRGHSSFVFCRSCGYVHKCEACDVAMTYHKYNDRLICHYCGRSAIKEKRCINCGSKYIKEFGAGTQMLEEQTKELFPNARVFRMDADTVNKKSDYDKVYNMMVNKEVDILIGTQMLAKGLDFPDVTLVGVMAADISLNIANYKANEKTFQLLTQVAGRAGRAGDYGDVVVQTYVPNNFAIQAACNNAYYEFFKEEIVNRQRFNYPPIIKILNINLASLDRGYCIRFAEKLIKKMSQYMRERGISLNELAGPVPSLIERINNKYRFDIILKSKEKAVLLEIADFIRKEKKDNKVYINYKLEE